MANNITPAEDTKPVPAPWSWSKKLIFRIAFIFFLAMAIPSTSGWYTNVVTLNWFRPHYRDIYDIARFQPSFQRWFSSGPNYGDVDGAPLPQERGDGGDNQKGGGKGGRHHHHNAGGADSTVADTGHANGGGHHHHHGGGGDENLAAGNQGNGEGHHHHHDHQGGDNNIAQADTTQGHGGGHHHHHHDEDGGGNVAQADTAGGHGHHHHHHDGGENALAGADTAQHHGHHHHDGSENELAGADTARGHGHHHHGDTIASTSAKDTTALVAVAPGSKNTNDDNNVALPPKRNFFADYTDWGIALLFGIVGGLIWTLLDRKSKSYNLLYYWIRVVVRYRAGIGIIGFGFTKLFPTQMPYPSLGLLNSNFGDFTAQKIYWMSVGIVPWYQVFGGIVEIVAGGMLFFRKTTLFGAILLAGALFDITLVNYAYDGGVHVYAFYFVLLSLFLIVDYIPSLYNLIIREKYTFYPRVYPDFSKPGLKYTRIVLKVLTFVIFFGVLTYTEVINFKYDPYKQPSTAGVKTLRGNYHVTEFKINGQELAYNPNDTTRWQEATFENWTTLSFRVNHPVVIDPSNGGGSPMHDIQRTFEITGVAGGERAFHYYADTVDKVLYLQDKNAVAALGSRRGGGRGGRGNRPKNQNNKPDNWISPEAWKHIGDESKMIDPAAWSTRRDREFAAKQREPKRARMILKYDTTDGNRVILSGVNDKKDSIYVVLDRYDRHYILPKSTLSAGKY
ncbi:hypothetical protein [Mucilaginibacter sp. dw_454]|uniref:hypothetical protein n=1 Tax=Mucilaginibacter sp. dw_454 TaxID=2720079 RepID=UPI001BD50E31|nr:hypothetical protein [Mucilaginibacter sp. dw_454]